MLLVLLAFEDVLRMAIAPWQVLFPWRSILDVNIGLKNKTPFPIPTANCSSSKVLTKT
jgi:hypothetical protein